VPIAYQNALKAILLIEIAELVPGVIQMYIEMRCKPFEYLHEPECLPAKSIQAGR
jgi:hypothetical protein